MRIQDLFDMSTTTPEAGWRATGGGLGFFREIGRRSNIWIRLAVTSVKLGSVDTRINNKILLYDNSNYYAATVVGRVHYAKSLNMKWLKAVRFIWNGIND